jgi:hypothetical protein
MTGTYHTKQFKKLLDLNKVYILCQESILAYFPFLRKPKWAYLIRIMCVCPPISTFDPADRFS